MIDLITNISWKSVSAHCACIINLWFWALVFSCGNEKYSFQITILLGTQKFATGRQFAVSSLVPEFGAGNNWYCLARWIDVCINDKVEDVKSGADMNSEQCMVCRPTYYIEVYCSVSMLFLDVWAAVPSPPAKARYDLMRFQRAGHFFPIHSHLPQKKTHDPF